MQLSGSRKATCFTTQLLIQTPGHQLPGHCISADRISGKDGTSFVSFGYKPEPRSLNYLGMDLWKESYAVIGLAIERLPFTLWEWMRIAFPSHNLLWFLQAHHEIRQITCAQSECGTGLAWHISHRRILADSRRITQHWPWPHPIHCQQFPQSCQVKEGLDVACSTSLRNTLQTVPLAQPVWMPQRTQLKDADDVFIRNTLEMNGVLQGKMIELTSPLAGTTLMFRPGFFTWWMWTRSRQVTAVI